MMMMMVITMVVVFIIYHVFQAPRSSCDSFFNLKEDMR